VFYAMMDVFTGALAWGICYYIRKWLLSKNISAAENFSLDYRFWMGISLVPVGWLVLYAIVGTYRSLYKKSRLFELTTTFICTLIGSIILFFVFILDDTNDNYSYYYMAFFFLLAIHFTLTFLGRFIFLNIAKQQLVSGTVQFNSLIVGNSDYVTRIFIKQKKISEVMATIMLVMLRCPNLAKTERAKNYLHWETSNHWNRSLTPIIFTRWCWPWRNQNTPWLRISLTA